MQCRVGDTGPSFSSARGWRVGGRGSMGTNPAHAGRQSQDQNLRLLPRLHAWHSLHFSRQQQPCPGTCVWPSPLCRRPGAPEVVRRESVALSWESRWLASAHRPHPAVLAARGPGSLSRCPHGFRAVPVRDAPLCPLCFSASAPRGPARSCLRAGSSQIGLVPASLSLGRPCRAGSSKFFELHASRMELTNSPYSQRLHCVLW